MTLSRYDTGYPTAPLTDPASGEVTPAWRRFFTCLWQRTGEEQAPALGVSTGALQAQLVIVQAQLATVRAELATVQAELDAFFALALATPVVVTPTGSPFIYTPPSRGLLFVAGGGVEAMTVRRGAGTFYPVGHFYGAFPLGPIDSVRITYLIAPQLVFFPE